MRLIKCTRLWGCSPFCGTHAHSLFAAHFLFACLFCCVCFEWRHNRVECVHPICHLISFLSIYTIRAPHINVLNGIRMRKRAPHALRKFIALAARGGGRLVVSLCALNLPMHQHTHAHKHVQTIGIHSTQCTLDIYTHASYLHIRAASRVDMSGTVACARHSSIQSNLPLGANLMGQGQATLQLGIY